MESSIDLHQQFFFSFSTFLNHFTLKHLKMTLNGKFYQKKWLRLGQNGQFWSFCRLFYLFLKKMRLRLTQNGQFHPIQNFSHLLPPKHLIFGEIAKIFIPGGCTLANFLSFATFSNCFPPKQLRMTHNGSKWAILVKFQQRLKYLSRTYR